MALVNLSRSEIEGLLVALDTCRSHIEVGIDPKDEWRIQIENALQAEDKLVYAQLQRRGSVKATLRQIKKSSN